jgi:hypothetical protein
MATLVLPLASRISTSPIWRIGLPMASAANIAVPINSSVTARPTARRCVRLCDAGRSVVGRAVAELGRYRNRPIQQHARRNLGRADALSLDAILQVDGVGDRFRLLHRGAQSSAFAWAGRRRRRCGAPATIHSRR